ncbi:MAG: hypothetical protein O7C56_05865, partial [Rickettsia endosymbiont of Ixodes persulcatus]|nr:hypothetical protein [Rickettsia endosymbiont of Ixodes persulcatus]
DGKPTTDRVLTGVAAGVKPNDAVNKGQLDVVDNKAVDAKKVADAAKGAADAAKGAADGSAAKLDGIATGEKVVDKINNASKVVGDSVAKAIGQGASAGADGAVTFTGLKLTSIGSGVTQPTTIVGGITALDTVVKGQGDTLVSHGGQIGTLQKDALLYNGAVYDAKHGGVNSRISNLADGTLDNDAVNLSQLNKLQKALNSGVTNLIKDDTVKGTVNIGAGSDAKTVDFSSEKPTTGADGKPTTDRVLTGVAAGVKPNDAVNKGQLDVVDGVAKAAKGSADESAEKLVGIATGETVVGRINDASTKLGQSVAAALGESTKLDADGEIVLGDFNLTSLGVDKDGNDIAQPTTVLGGIKALDTAAQKQRNALTANEKAVTSLETKSDWLTDRFDNFEDDALLWNQNLKGFSASHGANKTSRIVNLADGLDVNDAVNLGQLDKLKNELNTGTTGLVKSDPKGETLIVGGDSTAKVVDFTGKTPKLDDKGQPVLDVDGKPVLVNTDRVLTGVANGVAKNDAVNKGQLDVVGEVAKAAKGSADDSAAKLVGIGANETVVAKINDASKVVGESVAKVIGEGASVGADGKVTFTGLTLTSLGKDATGKDIAQPTTIVGGITALDTVVKGHGDTLVTQGKLIGTL